METYNTLFSDFTSLHSFLMEHDIHDNEQLLIRIHTSIHSIVTIQPFLKQLCELFPMAHIIGGSHGAVIYNSDILSNQCLFSFTQMKHTKLTSALFNNYHMPAQTLAQNVKESAILEHAQTAFVFFSNTYQKIAEFIEECNQFAQGTKLMGGVASDFQCEDIAVNQSSFIFCRDKVSIHGSVICSLKNEDLLSYGNCIYGVEKIGQAYTITKMNGICVEEVDHMNASQWYRHLLDEKSFAQDPDISKIFPFVLLHQNNSLRSIFYDRDQQKIHWIDEGKDGECIRLAYFSPKVTIEECRNICMELEQQSVESLFVYSCFMRREIMNQCCQWELSPFAQTSISGALCAGEICNVNGINSYVNSSCSILGLAEQPNVKLAIDKKALDRIGSLEYDNQHILTYLLKAINDDMYRTNSSLSRQILEQNNQMSEKLFLDPTTRLPNLTKFLYDRDHIDFNKLCIISTQNASMLRAHYGDTMCNHEILSKIQRCQEFLDDNDLYFYQHNQDCIMIAAAAHYSDDRFLKKIKGLFTYLGMVDIKENGFYYVNEFAVVIHEAEILEKAELTLSYIHRSSQRFLIYYPNLGLEDEIEEELQCLSHIKYAILHDGVEPYFQPIHDNVLHEIRKYESLMRLRTRDGRILYPNEFLDIAKKYKLYEELSRQMIAKVMNLYKHSKDTVTINLSVQDIYSDTTKSLIYTQLRQTSTPQNIVFEIVESEEIHKDNILSDFITNIRSYGAKIAIDDFGSGYSNLLKLIQLNADYIKIDGEIIRNMIHDEKCHQILNTILFLSEQTHTELIAEFVENDEIQHEIERMGIRFSQGYHFSRPKPFKDFHQE